MIRLRRRWLGVEVLGAAACFAAGVLLAARQAALDGFAGCTAHALAAFAGACAAGLLAGAALGGLASRKLSRPGVVAGLCLAALSVLLAAEPRLLAAVAEGWQRLVLTAERTQAVYARTLLVTAAALVLAPCALLGAALPAGARMLRGASGGRLSAAAAALWLLALAAGACAGPWLYASWGGEAAARLASVWFGALVTVAIAGGAAPRARWLRAALAPLPLALAMALAVALAPKSEVPGGGCDCWFGRLANRDSGFAAGRPLFQHVSGAYAFAAYLDPDYECVFTLDGRALLFGNRFQAARTLVGYAPLLARPACRRAAVVGPEAGFYLPFLARGGVSNLTVCGASRQLVNLAVEADAYVTRSEVASTASLRWGGLSAGAYDAILLAPAPAWRRGAQSLYSRRALLGYKRALAADGIVALHLDARALCEERLAAIARDFCSVFPGVQVWCTGAYDWVLIGGASPVKAPLDTLLSLYEREEVFRDFARAGGLSMPDALASMLCDGEGLRAWLNGVGSEGAWASAWRAPSNAIGTGRRVVQPAALERARQWKAGWLLPGQLDLDVYVSFVDKVGRSIGARSKAAAALADMAMGRGESALAQAQEAAKISPRDALLVQLAEIVELEGRRRIKIGDMAGALKCYENLLSFSPGSARAHYGMGYCLRGKGDGENAYLHFVRAVADAPEQAAYRFELAQAAVAIGEYAEADRQFKEGLRREPDNPEALFRYAKCLTIKDRPVKDFKQAASLAERACQLTGWKNSEYAFGLADLYMDAGRVLEGLGLKRRLKEGVKPAAPSAP